jgi:hypothetical protein
MPSTFRSSFTIRALWLAYREGAFWLDFGEAIPCGAPSRLSFEL